MENVLNTSGQQLPNNHFVVDSSQVKIVFSHSHFTFHNNSSNSTFFHISRFHHTQHQHSEKNVLHCTHIVQCAAACEAGGEKKSCDSFHFKKAIHIAEKK